MKHLVKTLAIALFAGMALTESCSKNGTQAVPPNTPSVSDTSAKQFTGSWVVSSYSQRTEDKSSLFRDYVFTFSEENVARAEKSGSTVSGTWLYSPSAVGYYGSAPSKASFTLNMGAGSPLRLLNKTWNIDTVHSNSSTLALVNPEPADNEQLSFSRQ